MSPFIPNFPAAALEVTRRLNILLSPYLGTVTQTQFEPTTAETTKAALQRHDRLEWKLTVHWNTGAESTFSIPLPFHGVFVFQRPLRENSSEDTSFATWLPHLVPTPGVRLRKRRGQGAPLLEVAFDWDDFMRFEIKGSSSKIALAEHSVSRRAAKRRVWYPEQWPVELSETLRAKGLDTAAYYTHANREWFHQVIGEWLAMANGEDAVDADDLASQGLYTFEMWLRTALPSRIAGAMKELGVLRPRTTVEAAHNKHVQKGRKLSNRFSQKRSFRSRVGSFDLRQSTRSRQFHSLPGWIGTACPPSRSKCCRPSAIRTIRRFLGVYVRLRLPNPRKSESRCT